MPGVLGKQGTLSFSLRLQSEARAARVGKEDDFHLG